MTKPKSPAGQLHGPSKEGSAFQPAEKGTRRCLRALADLSQAGEGRSTAPTVMRKANSKSARSISSLRQPRLITAARVTPNTYGAAILAKSRKTARMRRTARTVRLRR